MISGSRPQFMNKHTPTNKPKKRWQSDVSSRLEPELRPKLNVSRPSRTNHWIRRRDVWGQSRSSKCARNRRVDISGTSGVRKVRMIEDVEKLRPKLKVHAFRNPRVFHDREIPVGLARPAKSISTKVSK
jgi:hypothetical protein